MGSMNYILKKLVLNEQNCSAFKTLHNDIQKHLVLCTLVDESIIPGVGQWRIDSPGSFLWIL